MYPETGTVQNLSPARITVTTSPCEYEDSSSREKMPVQLQKPIKMKKHWMSLMVILVAQSQASWTLAEGVKFTRAFAPQEGMVTKYEEPARQELCLNGSWQF